MSSVGTRSAAQYRIWRVKMVSAKPKSELEASEAQPMKALGGQNRRLKRLCGVSPRE
jgi:hypothetical protein